MDVSPPLAGLPRRPVLRPGLAVVRHDDHHLQVGLDAPHRVVLPDHDDVRRLLDALCLGVEPPPTSPRAWLALRRLHEAGLLVDSAACTTATARAALAHFGAEAGPRLEARGLARVAVDAGPAHAQVVALLGGAGVRVVGGEEEAEVSLVVRDGEVPRALVDDLLRDGRAHLPVSSHLGRVRVGPLVVPGLTACLRCVDAHLGEADPRRALVVEQLARRAPVAEPRDPVLQALALAWAARDVLRLVEGDAPSTWSATVDVTPTGAPDVRAWSRHPECGCAWDEVLAVG